MPNPINRRAALGSIAYIAACSGPEFQARAANSVHPGHDSSQEYRAWVLGIDTTMSLRPDQFIKLKQILLRVVEQDLAHNDLVWLIEISGSSPVVQPFSMPAFRTRSQGRTAGIALDKAKSRLADAIKGLIQQAKTTQLQEPIETGLDILADHPMASNCFLVLGSDFITDTGKGLAITTPPPPLKTLNAAHTKVRLLIARPKPDYLRTLHASTPSDLYHIVAKGWSEYFRAVGAISVSAHPVDALATGEY